MTNIILINLIAMIFLAKKMALKYSIVIVGALSLFTVLGLNESPFKLNVFYGAPVEVLIFYAVAMIELIKGNAKNTALIIMLSLTTLLQKNDYLYLIQILIYIFLTLKSSMRSFGSKCKLLLFLTIWPTSVVIQNLYPSSELNTLLPIVMSYLILLKAQGSKKTSNELLFSIVISQIYFLKLSSDISISEIYLLWLFPLLTIASLVNYKTNKYVYPFIVIAPIIMFPSISFFALSMLFFIKIISQNEMSEKIELQSISNLNILKIIMVFVVVVATLLNFNHFLLIIFILVAYFFNQQRSPLNFLCDHKEDYRHLVALTLLLLLSLGKLIL